MDLVIDIGKGISGFMVVVLGIGVSRVLFVKYHVCEVFDGNT